MAARGRRTSPSRTFATVLAELRKIGQNRNTGAHGLALGTLRALRGGNRLLGSASYEETRSYAQRVADLLGTTQPAMGVFRRWATEWRDLARTEKASRLRERIVRWTESWQTQLQREPPALRKVVRRTLPAGERLLTLSRSDSVLRALTGLPRARRPREVVVLESRPGGEGRLLARDLRRAGIPARIVPDREALRWLADVDRVVLGADLIDTDGAVVHKVGTRRVALAALRRGVPVVVLAGISKGVDGPSPRRPLPALFDRTPARAITAYWTDRGVLKGGQWRSLPIPHPVKISRARR